jgi:poly(ADP-ribose) glycohydrolase
MEINEVILITGAERFANYSGYGSSLKFGGDFVDSSPKETTIVAMDAYRITTDFTEQFVGKLFERDLTKAFCAFSVKIPGSFATGNWGCGAFGNFSKKNLKV